LLKVLTLKAGICQPGSFAIREGQVVQNILIYSVKNAPDIDPLQGF
jgi:hypothetical protein